MKHEILIVGGGIGGLALALALHRRGIPSTVCERAAELTEVGAGLLLSPNAVHVLRMLGIAEEVEKRAVVTSQWELLDWRGRRLQVVRPSRGEVPALSVARSVVQAALLSAIPAGCLQLNREAVAVLRVDEGAEVEFADGSRQWAARLIGADGVNSRVRRSILGNLAPTYRGYLGWRAVVDEIPPGWRPARVTESWGHGRRFGIAPVSPGRTYWYATANAPAGTRQESGTRKQRLVACFARWHEPVGQIIDATPEDRILETAICDRPMRFQWSRGPVTLLGDAAHPMTPNLGQGAATALEDAATLAAAMVAEPTAAAFRHWEKARCLRKARVLWQSRFMGGLIQLEAEPLVRLRDGIIRTLPAWLSDRSLRPLFDFRA